jgi:hypothetical protein
VAQYCVKFYTTFLEFFKNVFFFLSIFYFNFMNNMRIQPNPLINVLVGFRFLSQNAGLINDEHNPIYDERIG